MRLTTARRPLAAATIVAHLVASIGASRGEMCAPARGGLPAGINGSAPWPEQGETDPPHLDSGLKAGHGNVRARLCVAADATAVVATIPWRQRRLINACYSSAPQPGPKPTPADPCTWKVYENGYNTSAIAGPAGNIACGGDLTTLLAECCKNPKCGSVSWLNGDGCLKKEPLVWAANNAASGYVPVTRT